MSPNNKIAKKSPKSPSKAGGKSPNKALATQSPKQRKATRTASEK